jgi:pyruvate dehydrogenase E2 component (dihydrolipoamide acetyltransferase)
VGASRLPLSRERIAGALRAVESKREAPHLYLATSVDLGPCLASIEATAVGPTSVADAQVEDVVLAACARALETHRGLNGRFVGDAIETWEEVHLAFSVAVGDVFAWPVLRSPGRLPLDALAALRRELQRRAGAGELMEEETSGSTFSVALLGPLGVETARPVLRAPQAGILAFGAPVRRPVVRGGGIEAGWVAEVALCCDQRAVEAPLAAAFLATLRSEIEQPVHLFGRGD